MAEIVDEISTTFHDEQGQPWTPRLTLPLVDRYCREQKIKFGEFSESNLSAAQLIDLVYLGTRYQTLAKANPQTRDEFLELLDGTSYEEALYAGRAAVQNFSLRSTTKKEDRPRVVALLTKQNAMLRDLAGQAKDRALTALEEALGDGATS